MGFYGRGCPVLGFYWVKIGFCFCDGFYGFISPWSLFVFSLLARAGGDILIHKGWRLKRNGFFRFKRTALMNC